MQLEYLGLRWVVKRGGSHQGTIHPLVVQHWGRREAHSFPICFLKSEGKILIEDFERLQTLDYPDDTKKKAAKDYPQLRLRKFKERYNKLSGQLVKGEINSLTFENSINELLNQFKRDSVEFGRKTGRQLMQLIDSKNLPGILSLIQSFERTESAQRLDILLKDINGMKEEEKEITELLCVLESSRKDGRIGKAEYRMIKDTHNEKLKDMRAALSRLKSCLLS
jgi:polyhydroxyalkanoate synthesis regulator phasin